jgi:hypothetical protein
MITIFEGVDGSGKSTRAEDLAKLMGATLLKNPVDWKCEDPFNAWLELFEKHRLTHCLYIDRSFLSNPVYRKWHGTPMDFTPAQFEKLCSLNFQVVYCESGTEYVDAMARGETNLKTPEDFEIIKKYYKETLCDLHKKHKFQLHKYNWRTDDVSSRVRSFEDL